MSTQPPKPWVQPSPTLLERIQKSSLRAAVAALVISLVFVLAAFLLGIIGILDGTRDRLPEIRSLAPSAGLVGVAAFVVLAPCMVVLGKRSMQDRAFTALGFAATFFGLAVLALFCTRLGIDVAEWFQQVPRLIEQENRRLVEAPRKFEKEVAAVAKDRDDELANVDADAVLSPDEKMQAKAELKKLLDPAIAEKQITLKELERARKRDSRSDTSPPAILWHFLTHGPSSSPQDAGIWYALLGSLWVALITVLFAVPVGVGAAIYLEEYRTEILLNRIIQVNINNLAGVPSVVYGILGSFVFVGLIFRPLENAHIAARNVLGGGLTLGLLTLPVVIVAAQEAIRAVPKSIRQGAIALGATRWQTTWRTVLPMSLPGILTGTILSLSRAIGEAAPLILFGAILYVDQEPSLFSRFTVLPMQIFAWAGKPPITLENGETIDIWRANAAMASVVLLLALLGMNALAIYFRNRANKGVRTF